MASNEVLVQFIADSEPLISEIDKIIGRFRQMTSGVESGPQSSFMLRLAGQLIDSQGKLGQRLEQNKAKYEEIRKVLEQIAAIEARGGKGLPAGIGAGDVRFNPRSGEKVPEFKSRVEDQAQQAFSELAQTRAEALAELEARRLQIIREGTAAERERLGIVAQERTLQEKINYLLSDARVGDVIKAREQVLRASSEELAKQALLLREQALQSFDSKTSDQLRSRLATADRQRDDALLRQQAAELKISSIIERIKGQIQESAGEQRKLAQAALDTAAAYGKGFSVENLIIGGARPEDADALARAQQERAKAQRDLADAEARSRKPEERLREREQQLGIAEAVQRVATAQQRVRDLQAELGTSQGATKIASTFVGLQAKLGSAVTQLERARAGTGDLAKAQENLNTVLRQTEAELTKIAARRGTQGTQGNNQQQLSEALSQQTPLLNKIIGGALNDFQRRFVATLQFAVSGALIFGAQQLAREFIQTAIEVERVFVDIASAFEFDTDAARGTSQFNRELELLRRKILEVSLELNVLPTIANEAAFALVSRFKNSENALVALKAQLLATKVATIDQSEALRSLTAISEAFAAQIEETNEGLTLQERILKRETLAAELQQKTLDQAVTIQQNWGVTVEDTVEGTARAAQVLGQLGFTAEETQALVAALSFAMGQTGSQAAEKLNRSLGQITSEKVKEELLAIARASEEFTLNISDFENGADVYFKILSQIDRLQDIDPQAVTDIFQAVGQRRELETVANLFQTGDLQRDIQLSFGQAAGAAEQRFSYLDQTVAETLASIAARFEELASNLQQLGLITPITVLVASLDALLAKFNSLLQIIIDIRQVLDTIPIPFTEGLGDAITKVVSLLLVYKSISRVLDIILTQRTKDLALSKGLLAADKLRFALTAPVGRGARVVRQGSGAVPGGFGAGGARTSAIAKLGAFATVAGVAAVAIGGLVTAINNSREAVAAWNRQLEEDTASVLAEIAKGPREDESRAQFASRIAELERTQFIERGVEPRDVGDILLGGSIEKLLTFEGPLPGLDLQLAEALVDELQDGLSGLPGELEGEDLFIAGEYREVLRREQQKLIALSREGADPKVIAASLLNLQRVLEVFNAFSGRVRAAAEEEDADTLKSIRDKFALIGEELDLGFLSPGAALKDAATQLDKLEFRATEDPSDEALQKALRDGQKSYIAVVRSILEERLAQAGTIEDDSTRTAAEVAAYEAAHASLVNQSLDKSRDAQGILRDMFSAQTVLADGLTGQLRQLGQALLGISRNLQEKAEANDKIVAAIWQEYSRLSPLDAAGRSLLLLEITQIRRNEADEKYAEMTQQQVETYKAGLPAQSQLAQVGGELIRVERELANWTGDESGRIALLNEARGLRLDRQRIYIDRVKASLLLQAGVRDSMLELKAQITSVAKDLELTAAAQGVESEAYKSLKLSQLKLKSQLVDSTLELEDINRRLGSDLTNAFEQAQLDLVEVLRQLQLPDLGELERAQLELEKSNAEAREQAAYFNDRLFQLKFLSETGELGTGAYIGALERLLSQVDTSTQQGKEIFLQIQGLIDGLVSDVSDLAFNVPSSIRIPTLFEIRRSLAADQLGVNYQDNRQMDIEIVVSNEVDMAEVVSLLGNAIGDSITIDSARFAPGAAGITLGGF